MCESTDHRANNSTSSRTEGSRETDPCKRITERHVTSGNLRRNFSRSGESIEDTERFRIRGDLMSDEFFSRNPRFDERLTTKSFRSSHRCSDESTRSTASRSDTTSPKTLSFWRLLSTSRE
jgi:hypothetical protein